MVGLHPPTGAPGRALDPTLTRLEGLVVAEATPVGEVSAPRPLSNGAWCHSKIRPLDGRIDPGRTATGHVVDAAPDEDVDPGRDHALLLTGDMTAETNPAGQERPFSLQKHSVLNARDGGGSRLEEVVERAKQDGCCSDSEEAEPEEDGDGGSDWDAVEEVVLLETTAVVVRVASTLGGDAFYLVVDGDEDAQEELCELCDCDPELFDMLGAMVSGYTVSEELLDLHEDKQEVLGCRIGDIFFTRLPSHDEELLADRFADWLEDVVRLLDAEAEECTPENSLEELQCRVEESAELLQEIDHRM
eukprot:COSAG02_NODE_1985_length_10186_cov_5.320214_1_plen_303_part_00